MERSKRLGEASIPRLLATFSIPAVVGLLAQAAYNLVDRVFVGRAVGQPGIAGIAVSFPYMLVLLAFGLLIGVGSAAVISIRLGEKRKEEAELVLGNAALLAVGISLCLTAVGWVFCDRLLTISGASPEVLPYARDYLEIIVLGSLFQVFGFGMNAVIRGEGNPWMAMLTLLIGVVLNGLLAPLFIFQFGWGMRGAALATVLSQAVSALWVLAYFLSGRSLLAFQLRRLRLDPAVAKTILAVGSPPFVMQLAASGINVAFNNQLQRYGGDLAVSVMGVTYVVVMLIAMPVFGINQGAQPIIGYNYGAERYDRVRRTLQTAALVATTITVLGFLLMMLFPAEVIRLFSREDEALVQLGTHAMRISAAMLPLVGFQIVGASYFQAVGKPRQAMFLSLSRQVLLMIPAVLLLPRFFGLDGVWAAMPAADLGSALLTGVWLAMELRHLGERHEQQGRPPSTAGTPTAEWP